MASHSHARDVSRTAQGTATTPSLLARPAMARGADAASPQQTAPLQVAPPQTAPPGPGTLQRQSDPDAEGGTPTTSGGAAGGGGAASSSCIEAVVGEEPTTLTEAGVVTIVEFNTPGCSPCKILQANLEQMCAGFKTKPPAAPVHIFSIDISESANEDIGARYTDAHVPHIYFYVGNKEKDHYATALQPDTLDMLVKEYAEEASQSSAWKGAKKGAKWGGLIGGIAGIAASIGIGKGPGFGGTDPLLAIGGLIGGGIVAGGLLGGTIGAIAGKLGEEKKGSRRKKKPQPKRRAETSRDPEESEADAMAAHVMRQSAAGDGAGHASASLHGGPNGAPLDAGLRLDMESHFGRDFSHVRLHRDAGASRVADGMQAYAVTEGPDIYFARDGYAPHTPAGRAILAHELTHVVQQDVSGSSAAPASLESEAARASAQVAHGRQADVTQAAGGDAPPLPMTRAQHTLLWSVLGLVGGAAVGAGIGALAAWKMGTNIGDAAKTGALIGGGAGLIAGFFGGLFVRRTSRVGAQEADALIRKRYGKYLPQGVPAPLRDALVHPVSKAELEERFACRHQTPPDGEIIGWTDTGTPWKGARPPAQTIASQAGEPTCNNKQLEHATPQRPVIYFQSDTPDAGILVHEGLHALSHPEFQRLHNFVNEGATELYTRRLLADVNIAVYGTGYDRNVRDVERFESVVGEEPLARAYFAGDVPALDRLMTPVYGPCSMLKWALSQEANKGDSSAAESVLINRGVDYCPEVNFLMRVTPSAPSGPHAPAAAPGTPAAPAAPTAPAGLPTGGQGGRHP
jgi:hypothetical protein